MTIRTETFAMIKPDATERGVEAEMLAVIEAAGFHAVEARRVRMSEDDARWLYREHRERDHFSDLVAYTVSGDVIMLRLAAPGSDAALSFRTLMGATDRTKAAPGTLRARFAVGYRENSIHGSDSPETASLELARFFPESDGRGRVPGGSR